MSHALVIPADDPRLAWAGHASLEPVGGGAVRPWRLPHGRIGLFPGVDRRAREAAGVRVRVRTDADAVAVDYDICEDDGGARPMDVVVPDPRLPPRLRGCAAPEEVVELPRGEKVVELWLSHSGSTVLRSIALRGARFAEAAPASGRRWTTYGSSITQARQARHPTACWPARAAIGRGLDLTNLGFAGECHLDPLVADVIAATPADLISLCLGINVYGAGSLGPRAFVPAVLGFVSAIRRRQPTVPVVIVSPIFSPERETTPNAVGYTLEGMRSDLRRAVDLLRDHGDARVQYVDGLDVFGPEHAARMPDGLHPDHEAQAILADNVSRLVLGENFGVSSGV